MKNEVTVSKSLAETLRQKKSVKEHRDFLRRLIILERASQPIKKDGKLIITEQAAKTRILLEIFGSSISTYTQIWKEIVDTLKDVPSPIETVFNQLSKKEYQDVDDEEAIQSLEEFVGELSKQLDKVKKLKQEISKRDEEIKQYADSISPGADVVTPSEINLDQVNEPQDINPQNQAEGGESKAKITANDL